MIYCGKKNKLHYIEIVTAYTNQRVAPKCNRRSDKKDISKFYSKNEGTKMNMSNEPGKFNHTPMKDG
jgi:hypothetical protein